MHGTPLQVYLLYHPYYPAYATLNWPCRLDTSSMTTYMNNHNLKLTLWLFWSNASHCLREMSLYIACSNTQCACYVYTWEGSSPYAMSHLSASIHAISSKSFNFHNCCLYMADHYTNFPTPTCTPTARDQYHIFSWWFFSPFPWPTYVTKLRWPWDEVYDGIIIWATWIAWAITVPNAMVITSNFNSSKGRAPVHILPHKLLLRMQWIWKRVENA